MERASDVHDLKRKDMPETYVDRVENIETIFRIGIMKKKALKPFVKVF